MLADDGEYGLTVWRDAAHIGTKINAPQSEPWAVSGDGRVAVVFDGAATRPSRIDLEQLHATPMVMVPFTEPGEISAALDRRGGRVAFGATRGELIVMTVADGEVLMRQRVTERALTQLVWSPDDRWLAVRDEPCIRMALLERPRFSARRPKPRAIADASLPLRARALHEFPAKLRPAL